MARPYLLTIALSLLALWPPFAEAGSACSINLEMSRQVAYHALGKNIDAVSGPKIGLPFEVVAENRMTTYRFGREDCYIAFSTFEGDDTIRAYAQGVRWGSPSAAETAVSEYLEGLSNAFTSEPAVGGVHRWSWGDVKVEWKAEGPLTELAFLWLGSGETPSIPTIFEGVWERQGDHYAGMRVRVYRTDDDPNTFAAELVSVPQAARQAGFEVGQVKWANIYRLRDGYYSFEDLFTGGLSGSRRRESAIRTEGDRLQTALMDGEGALGGQAQTWTKVWSE